MPASGPNVLFVQADQLTAFALAAYGNRVCRTLHIDRLAETGVVFELAYCNFPLCAPSRFSMMTVQLASRISAFDNAAEPQESIPPSPITRGRWAIGPASAAKCISSGRISCTASVPASSPTSGCAE